jgi:hypothetical protein
MALREERLETRLAGARRDLRLGDFLLDRVFEGILYINQSKTFVGK